MAGGGKGANLRGTGGFGICLRGAFHAGTEVTCSWRDGGGEGAARLT
jgi:hypothetical protein